MRFLAATVMLAFLAPAQAHAEATVRYTVLFQGKPSGVQTTHVADDGSVTVDYSYRNNGRGPDLKEEFTLAADGTLLRYSGNGKSTFGGPIQDSFTRRGVQAEWKSLSDQGGAPVAGASAYVPVEPSPEVLMRIIRAVASQPGQRLAALPAGELKVEKLADERVEASGKSRELSLYALTGMNIEPEYFWATRAPEMTFFALIFPGWIQVIESGWESVAPKLERRQVEANNKRLTGLAASLRHPLPEPIVIRNAAHLRRRACAGCSGAGCLHPPRANRRALRNGLAGARCCHRSGRRRPRALAGALRHARARKKLELPSANRRRRDDRSRPGQ